MGGKKKGSFQEFEVNVGGKDCEGAALVSIPDGAASAPVCVCLMGLSQIWDFSDDTGLSQIWDLKELRPHRSKDASFSPVTRARFCWRNSNIAEGRI